MQKKALNNIEKAYKIVEAADQKLIRTAKQAFKEVVKVAYKKRANSSLKPLYIVNKLGGGRDLVRG